MNTEQGNELIDIWMGVEYNIFGPTDYMNWNNLMPVVDRIESLKFWVRICLSSCYIDNCNTPEFEEIIMVDADSKIEAVWQAVVEFIQWLNQNSK